MTNFAANINCGMSEIVLRIQTPDGHGPYCGEVLGKVTGKFRDTRPKKNWPAPSGQMWMVSCWYNHRYAFPSVKALVKWFPSWQRRRLAKLGFKLIVVQSEEIIKDDAQAIYNPFKSKVLRELPVDSHFRDIQKEIKSLDIAAN